MTAEATILGYNVAGSETTATTNSLWGSWFTAGSNGNITSITLYAGRGAGTSVNVSGAVYQWVSNTDAGNLLGTTVDTKITSSTAAWYTMNMKANVAIVSGTKYFITYMFGNFTGASPHGHHYRTSESSKGIEKVTGLTYPTFPSPLASETGVGYRYSVYAVYTESGTATVPSSSVSAITPYFQKKPCTITATATDAAGDVNVKNVSLYYRFSANNASWGGYVLYTTIQYPTAWSWSFNPTNGTGYYQFYTIAKDVDGNAESAPGSADRSCVVDGVLPVSSVDAISPYIKTSSPITITATASDDMWVKSVGLWYRKSLNNITWGSWTSFETDTSSPWSWSFPLQMNNFYYQFYSIAIDNSTNTEVAPGTCDQKIFFHQRVWTPGGSFIINTAWWNSQWLYRKTAEINTPIIDYQMRIVIGYGGLGNVTLNGECRTDFGDVRFINSSGDVLSYWMETYTSGVQATFWVKTKGSSSIYIYYGNSAATTTSNGTATFLEFCDFTGADGADPVGWTDAENKWSIQGNVLQSVSSPGSERNQMYITGKYYKNARVFTKMKTDQQTMGLITRRLNGTLNQPNYLFSDRVSGNPACPYMQDYYYNGVTLATYLSTWTLGANLPWGPNTWWTMEVRMYDNYFSQYMENTYASYGNLQSILPNAGLLGVASWDSGVKYIDDFRVAKWTNVSSEWRSFGSKELPHNWNTFASLILTSWTNVSTGYNTFENIASWQTQSSGWNTFGNISFWVQYDQGWNTFGNTTTWKEESTGWNTFSNTAGWKTEHDGWNTFGNVSSWIQYDLGWNTFGNVSSWVQYDQGWNTFGNSSSWSDIDQGWNTFENNATFITIDSGWNIFGNTSSWVQYDQGWNTFGNISTWDLIEDGWNTFNNTPHWGNIKQGWNTFGNINHCPVVTVLHPTDGSTIYYNMPLPNSTGNGTLYFNASIFDQEADWMNASLWTNYSGSWVCLWYDWNTTNITISIPLAVNYTPTIIYWSINTTEIINSTCGWDNETYHVHLVPRSGGGGWAYTVATTSTGFVLTLIGLSWGMLFLSWLLWRQKFMCVVLAITSMMLFFASAGGLVYITQGYAVYDEALGIVVTGEMHLASYQSYSMVFVFFGLVAMAWLFVRLFDWIMEAIIRKGILIR